MNRFDWSDKVVVARIERAAVNAISDALQWAQATARRKMNISNLTTKQARRKSPGVKPNYSAPGEYPHKGTGHLQASIGYEVTNRMTDKVVRGKFGYKQGRLTKDEETGSDYGLALEFGTSRMAARPHIRPTIQDNTKKLSNRITARFKRDMK